jgi:hypothetical protein
MGPKSTYGTPNDRDSAKGRRGDILQRRNVMLTIRTLAAAIIRISEPSKLLKTRNIGTLTVPNTHYYRSPTKAELARCENNTAAR